MYGLRGEGGKTTQQAYNGGSAGQPSREAGITCSISSLQTYLTPHTVHRVHRVHTVHTVHTVYTVHTVRTTPLYSQPPPLGLHCCTQHTTNHLPPRYTILQTRGRLILVHLQPMARCLHPSPSLYFPLPLIIFCMCVQLPLHPVYGLPSFNIQD